MADWKDSIVLLTSSDRGTTGFGTGFVFHRDSTGRCFLLTCLHVVEVLEQGRRRAPDEPVMILADGKPAEVWQRGDKILDLAVLAVDGLTARSVPLGVPASGGERIETAGYTTSEEEHDSVTRRPLSGTVKGNNPVKFARRPGRISASYLDLEFQADVFGKLDEGYSGSPVRDEASGAVVGIMNIKRSSTHGHAVCVGSCERFEKKLADLLPDYSPGARPVPIPLARGTTIPTEPTSAAAAEGALDWLASTIDHGAPLEVVARRLDGGERGLWFYAFDACGADCPERLAEHLAVEFGGLRTGGSWRDDLVVRPHLVQFDENGLWKAMVDELSPPGSRDLSPDEEEDLILGWINSSTGKGSAGGLRVVYAKLYVPEKGSRMHAFITGAIERLRGLQGVRSDARVLFLFGCVDREHDWLRALGMRRRPRMAGIRYCGQLGSLSKVSWNDVDDWLADIPKLAHGAAGIDTITPKRLAKALKSLFPDDRSKLRYSAVCDVALPLLQGATLSASPPGDLE